MKTHQQKTFIRPRTAAAYFCLILLTLIVTTGCHSSHKSESQNTQTPLPSEGCSLLWEAAPAKEFVDLLVKATATEHPVWEGYDLGDGAYVLNAGKKESGESCIGLWKAGKVLDYNEVEEAPKLATPLYGYYLNYPELKPDMDTTFISFFKQPEAINTWMEEFNVETAIIMPTEFPNFPFELSALQKVQLGIHEAFHTEVQIRYWNTAKAEWPEWDLQPDRNGLQACYSDGDEVKALARAEQDILSEMLQALLNEDKELAIQKGNDFLETRASRYAKLEHVKIQQQDESFDGCEFSEAMLELEEGGADYASWTMLYEINLAPLDKLIGRYGASQAEPFYLTGSMQLHAISLMQDDMPKMIREIARSKTQAEGSVAAIFKRVLREYGQ